MHEQDRPKARFSPVRLLGVFLRVGGLTADIAVGFAILRGGSPALFLLHIIAVGVWTEGICVMDDRNVWDEIHAMLADRSRRRDPERADAAFHADGRRGWNAQTLVIALLAVVLFPGFGPVGCTTAFALAALPFMVRRQHAAPVTDIGVDNAPLVIEPPTNPLLDLAVQPLIDVINTSDVKQKHAAIRLLGQQFDNEAVHLLRGLLTDPDPDVRSEASVTLFRFEDLTARAVNEGAALAQVSPTAERHAAHAAAYCHAVSLGLLDGPSVQFYLSEACNAYQRAATLAPERTEYWVALAQVYRDLGNIDSALLILEKALNDDPGNVQASLLCMEIAFAERRWDIVASSLPAPADASSSSVTHDLFRWWAGDSTARETTTLVSIHTDDSGHAAREPSPERHRDRMSKVGGNA